MCCKSNQINKMAERGDGNKWKNFAKKMAAKRDINKRRNGTTDSKNKNGIAVTNDAITVQRLSASVSGKAQNKPLWDSTTRSERQ